MYEFREFNYVKYIRDPIHGLIGLYQHEKEIIDLPIFQRLRNISQLGFARYIYPSAVHSRFEHSIGVLQAITDFYEALLKSEATEKDYSDFLQNTVFEYSGGTGYLPKLRLAGLLHDLGHPPFSHGLEAVLDTSHEEYTYELLKRSSIRDTLFSHGWSNNDIIDIRKILTGDLDYGELFLKSMINSAIDADRMDYLLRDSYHCGVKYGVYDYPRLMRGPGVREFTKEIDGSKKTVVDLIFSTKVTEEVENFLMARYRMFIQIYLHKTYIGFLNALWVVFRWLKENEDNLGLTLYPSVNDPYLEENLIERDEFWLISLLRNVYRQLKKPFTHFGFDHVDKDTLTELLESILFRKRIKLVYHTVIQVKSGNKTSLSIDRRKIVKELSTLTGVPESAIMVDDQSFSIYQSFKPDYQVYLYDGDSGQIFRIDEVPMSIINSIAEKEFKFLRIYTLEKYQEKVTSGLKRISKIEF